MAADPALAAILQEMQLSNRGLQQALQQQQAQMEEQRRKHDADIAALQAMVQQQNQGLERLAGRSDGVVDVKQVGKPDNLKGSKEAILELWPTWMFTFTTWFCSQFAKRPRSPRVGCRGWRRNADRTHGRAAWTAVRQR